MRYFTEPCNERLENDYRIFSCIKRYNWSKLVFVISWPVFGGNKLIKADWFKFHPNEVDIKSPNVPESFGNKIDVNCFYILAMLETRS